MFLGLMPLGMAISHRSAVLFIAVSTVLAVCAAMAEGVVGQLCRDMLSRLLSLPGKAVLVFLVWAALSLTWTAQPLNALFTLSDVLLTSIAGFVVVVAVAPRMPPWGPVLAACSGIGAALLIFADIETGLWIRQTLGARAYVYIFNRPVLTLLLAMIPLTFLLWRRPVAKYRIAGIVGAALTIAIIFRSDSGAATMAVFIFVPVYIVARLSPRLARCLGGLCFIMIFATAPIYGSFVEKELPAKLVDVFRSDHAVERIALWQSFEHAIQAQPIAGGGFNVSPVIANTPVVEQIPAEYRSMIAIGHPHNAAMQVWVELGAVGAILALAALLAMLRSLSSLPPNLAAEQLGWIAGVTFVAIVGHGAWQSWWIAAISAGLAWFTVERQEAKERQ